ncbi:MAG TPA: 3-oxoacyl-ACP reductase FabG [Acidimicrobiia bacterium]|nr:3-oxoacyl-ACP reductase FabG [Acidimicrobiia bacterium]
MEDQPGRVLITGASRGIGAAIAARAAEAGWSVVIGYRDHDEEASRVVEAIESAGGRAVALAADLADGQAARGLVTAAEASVGPLTALVNNAGIMPVTPFLEIPPEEWDRVIATDLSAAFHTTQAVLPGMLDRGHGRLVNVSSRLGQIGMNNVVHYAAAKAGLLGFTKSLAREFGPRGIRVNAVAPGVTLTAMSTDVAEGEEGRRRLSEIPAGRFAEPDDVAAAVMFLLSDEAAMFHGQTLCPNGGGFMP